MLIVQYPQINRMISILLLLYERFAFEVIDTRHHKVLSNDESDEWDKLLLPNVNHRLLEKKVKIQKNTCPV